MSLFSIEGFKGDTSDLSGSGYEFFSVFLVGGRKLMASLLVSKKIFFYVLKKMYFF